MDSVNVEVLRCAANWIEAGIAVTLATVLKTWFSLPCVPAAQLAISGDGRLVGSVSGGCIEDDLIECLHSPVGLPLGSKTPPEIALAIMADITARRNGVELICRSPVAACAGSSAICPVLA
ncbi:XdhC family protein [Candidatus Aalborgicola defluviihabitans]|jgi:xanthine dehydrogenase accessory factor|uniref:XdhC family protein n=1 Tax=Candidatus Aalborgicola defluviihabitans TaxID=3386187 RepID=UPI001D8A1987|nr:XdhC family protein [Burkholderiales bacterium]MBK6570686.1 XdhC family protein [Burkholderiales bacterium]MBK7279681.1 XdhC family protein [Burkholderiales bacterium]MBK7312633.1 XdhC family protein [Burkholderiales bacterium]MBL0243442.1 XdhC family protein [Rhodoferax sp.]